MAALRACSGRRGRLNIDGRSFGRGDGGTGRCLHGGGAKFRSLVAKPASGQAEARKFRLFEVEERLFQRQAAIPDDNAGDQGDRHDGTRTEEHTSELQSLMRISYAVFCLKKKKSTLLIHCFFFLVLIFA